MSLTDHDPLCNTFENSAAYEMKGTCSLTFYSTLYSKILKPLCVNAIIKFGYNTRGSLFVNQFYWLGYFLGQYMLYLRYVR